MISRSLISPCGVTPYPLFTSTVVQPLARQRSRRSAKFFSSAASRSAPVARTVVRMPPPAAAISS